MLNGSNLQHLLSSITEEQVGYFSAGIYPKPALCQKIQTTKDLRKQLQLINQHIRSLVTYPYEGQVYVEHNINRKDLIFCVCKKCKKDFTPKQHNIFLEERIKELHRIQKQIDKLSSYTKKLDYLFQLKPFSLKRFQIKLYDNIEAEKEGLKPALSIDLYPKTLKERQQAAHLIKDYLIEANTKNDLKLLDYKERYPITLLSALQEELQQRLEKCGAKSKQLLQQEINLIQENLKYPSKQYTKDRNYTTLYNNISYTYNYIADGFSIDYKHIDLDVNTITKAIKAEQAFAYTQHLQSLLEKEEKNIESISANKQFTLARQVLVFHYIFEYCKVGNVDQSKKAEFIHFITGKNKKNIYDLVRSPLATKTKEFRKEDLQFIRTYFEDLKMEGIIRLINNELDKMGE